MPNYNQLIQILIFILVLGAAWYLFNIGAAFIGLPAIVMQVLTVLFVVFLIVYALRYLAGQTTG